MRRRSVLSGWLAWAVAAVGATAAGGACHAAGIYVAPNGKGTGHSPSDALGSIQAGVDAARPGDTVWILSGTYRETVTFHRSGTLGRPISVAPYRGAKVTVSGCDPLPSWRPYRERPGVWQAPMGWTLGLGRNQVFSDGQVLIEARYPNQPAPGLGMYVAGLSPLWPTYGEFSIPEPEKAPGRVTSKLLAGHPRDYWKGAIYSGLHYEGWCAQTGVVEASEGDHIDVGDRTQTWWFPYPGSGYSPEEGRGMLIGTMNALDQPGEWCRQGGTLYLMTGDGRPPRRVEAKRRQLAFDLSGQSYVHIRGISVRAASMRLDGSAYCRVESCDLEYLSHFTLQYAMGQVEHGKDTIRSGETGIFVGGHDNAFVSCRIRYSAGAGFHLRGYHHTIHNCLIDEVDYTAHYLNPITDAVSDYGDYEGQLVGGHVITYNTMRNAGRHMFNLSGNGTSLASRTRGPMDYMATLFAHNHLYNGMLLTKDAGMLTGYYCSGGTLDGLNSVVAYNVMHDTWDIFAMRINVLGIVYLDAGTCNVTLHDNLLWAAPGSLQRGLWYNTMCVGIQERDNVFHPDFSRTSSQLRASDFPRGRPFRFGHDFAHPPAVPAWPLVESQALRVPALARYFHNTQPVLPEPDDPARAGTSGPVMAIPTILTELWNGTAVPFGVVDFDKDWLSAVMRYTDAPAAANREDTMRAAPRHTKPTDPLVLEATVNDGTSQGIGTQWTFVRNVSNGAWLRFRQVPLGAGYRRFRAVYGCVEDAKRAIEVRLDASDGPLVSTVQLKRTDRARGGSIQIYGEATADVEPVAMGTHDVYLVFRCDDGKPVGEFEYFRFEQGRDGLRPTHGELRVELRIDSPSGDRIGTFHPRPSPFSPSPAMLVTSLEPVTGRHALFATVATDLKEYLGSIDGLRLERARQPQGPTGIGAPPLMDRRGRLILPVATNRPIARPADRYGHTSAPPDAPLVRSKAAATGRYLPRAGLALWLDAAAKGAVEQDQSGAVIRWRDRSGHGRDAIQQQGAHRPVVHAHGIGGLPAIAFDEARQTRLEVPDLSRDKTSATVFAVVSNPKPASEVNHDARILTASDGKELDYLTGICLSVPGLETGGPRQIRWNGTGRWGRYVRVGCFSPLYQTYFTGQIAEILAYDRILTPAETVRVRTYLYSKWGAK